MPTRGRRRRSGNLLVLLCTAACLPAREEGRFRTCVGPAWFVFGCSLLRSAVSLLLLAIVVLAVVLWGPAPATEFLRAAPFLGVLAP